MNVSSRSSVASGKGYFFQQMFGYTLDVLFPECLIYLLMEVQKLQYTEVCLPD